MVCSKKKKASEGEEDDKHQTVSHVPAKAVSAQGHHKGGNLLPFPDACESPAGLWQQQPAPSPA